MIKKILMVIPSYEPAIGGAELQVKKLLSKFIDEPNLVFYVVTRKLSSNVKNKSLNKNIIFLPCFKSNIIFSFLLFFYLLFNLRKISIIHCHTLSAPFFSSAFFSILFKKNLITKVTRYGNGSQIHLINKNFLKRSLFNFVKSKVFFIALNSEIKKQLISNNIKKNKIIEIPNGVEIPSYRKSTMDGGKFNLLFIGRLIDRKRVNWIFDFLVMLKTKNITLLNKIIFHIVGDGPLLNSYQDISKKNNLHDYIVFHGKVTESNIKEQIFKKCDLFILPSKSEGMSNSLLEAMSYKLCCIVSNISSNSFVVKNNFSGLLFNSKKEFFQLTEYILNNPEEINILGSNAYKYVKNNLDINFIYPKYLNLYLKL